MQEVTRAILIAVLAVALAACSNMSPENRKTAERVGGGTAIGAATGAIFGAIGGNAALGAAAGAGAGMVGGFLYDEYEKHKQKSYDEGYAAGQSQSGR